MRKVLLLAALFCFMLSGAAFAFHDQGVADCQGCHTMHNSEDGAPVDPDSPAGNPYLLRDATPSDVCLGCHARHVLADDVLNPQNERGAGNFIFLLEDNINDGHGGASSPIDGSHAGHSINAPGYGLSPETGTAPGGTFNSANLGCSSCHDPHGTAGFRILYGVGGIQDGLYNFTNPAPLAVGNSRSTSTPESPNFHTWYQSGMSQWCANCHGDFHNTSYPTVLKHPSGAAIDGLAAIYNQYNGTSDQTGGAQATAYLPAVPFEDDDATLYGTTSSMGPDGQSRVMCLTCHRAHATSAQYAGRWDFQIVGPAEDGHESGSYAIPNPYDGYQRSLCNKCHNKDANDALIDFTPVP